MEDGIFGTSGGIGFTKENELFVGRVAMLGFAVCFFLWWLLVPCSLVTSWKRNKDQDLRRNSLLDVPLDLFIQMIEPNFEARNLRSRFPFTSGRATCGLVWAIAHISFTNTFISKLYSFQIFYETAYVDVPLTMKILG